MAKTYEEIQKEIEHVKVRLLKAEDECAKKGLSFDEMILETIEDRKLVFNLDKDARLVQDPSVQYKKKWKGVLIPMEDFKEKCDGILTDEDGYGLYATETSVSDVKIYPSDILEKKYRSDFTHVMWFEKK